jgi:hypothetical protein
MFHRAPHPPSAVRRSATAKEATSVGSAQEPDQYEIRVKGHLADRWAAWFDGMTLTRRTDGTTVLGGPVADQSALHGLLRKVSDLGLPLVSVTPTAGIRTSTAAARPQPVDDDQ